MITITTAPDAYKFKIKFLNKLAFNNYCIEIRLTVYVMTRYTGNL